MNGLIYLIGLIVVIMAILLLPRTALTARNRNDGVREVGASDRARF